MSSDLACVCVCISVSVSVSVLVYVYACVVCMCVHDSPGLWKWAPGLVLGPTSVAPGPPLVMPPLGLPRYDVL